MTTFFSKFAGIFSYQDLSQARDLAALSRSIVSNVFKSFFGVFPTSKLGISCFN